MSPNDLFAEALPLRRLWIISDSRLESKPGEARRLHLTVDLEEGCRRLACPECDAPDCPVHDRLERQWKHLNFWQYETILSARVPRVKCERCGVHQVAVPWAREGSGFTLLFEAMAMLLCNHMSVAEASAMLGEHDTRIWRIVIHYVNQAREACDWSAVRRVGIDEVSRKKGQLLGISFFIPSAPFPPKARGRRGFGTIHVAADLDAPDRRIAPSKLRYQRGYLADFAATVSQADEGCVSRWVSRG